MSSIVVVTSSIMPSIVVGATGGLHRPVYCSEDGAAQPGSNQFQVSMEPLMVQYDVDIVIQGHMHAYERIHPLVNGEVTVEPVKEGGGRTGVDVYKSQGKGPVYVVQGNTGAMQFERWANPQPDYSAIPKK